MPDFSAMPDDALEERLQEQARTGACPHPDLLFALREGVLPPEGEASLRAHAGQCPLCRTLLESEPCGVMDEGAFTRIGARIRARMENQVVRGGGWRRPLVWIPAAAALLLAAGLAIRHSASHPAAASLPAEVVTIAALAPPDLGPDLVTRGAPAAAGPNVADLLPAFQSYNRGDYAPAATAFEQLGARFPHSGIPPLYQGVAQLQLGQNAAAQRALLRALPLAGAEQRSAAAWYLAVADVRLAQSSAARPLLRDLCARPTDAFSARACSLSLRLKP